MSRGRGWYMLVGGFLYVGKQERLLASSIEEVKGAPLARVCSCMYRTFLTYHAILRIVTACAGSLLLFSFSCDPHDSSGDPSAFLLVLQEVLRDGGQIDRVGFRIPKGIRAGCTSPTPRYSQAPKPKKGPLGAMSS
jgi:hypothetical protein